MFDPLAKQMRPKRVVVDRLKCQGTGYCVRIAPRLFELAGEGPAEVKVERITEADLGLLIEAEDACPTRAIWVDR